MDHFLCLWVFSSVHVRRWLEIVMNDCLPPPFLCLSHTHTRANPHAPALGTYFNAPFNGCIIFIIVHYSDLNQGLSAC